MPLSRCREGNEKNHEEDLVAIKFLTDDWAEAVTSAANADEQFRAAAKGHHLLLQAHVEDSPSESDYFMYFGDGVLTVATGTATEPADVTAEMSYQTNVSLSKGDLNGQTAAMTGQMKVHGDMMKMMSLGKAQDRVAEIESGLDIEY